MFCREIEPERSATFPDLAPAFLVYRNEKCWNRLIVARSNRKSLQLFLNAAPALTVAIA